MTVTANTTRNDYTAGSAQSVYNYTFQLNEAADVDVYLDGVKQTLNTHYTVQNVDNATGGTITFTLVDANNNPIHPTQGAVINIVMAMDLDRDTNYQPSGAFLAADVNNDFDRLWHSTNQQQTAINRSLRLKDTDVTTSSMELPLKDDRKGKLLGFNVVTGDPEVSIAGNNSSWDLAYDNMIVSAAFTGGSYTLTQQDGGTISTSLDGRYLPLAGGTLTGDFNVGFNKLTVGRVEIEGVIGDHSIIKETGGGDLYLQGTNLKLLTGTGSESFIECIADGNVNIYHDGTARLSATFGGASVNGGLTVSGTLDASGYNDSNWNDAYNNKITAVNYSGSTLTLTQQDGGTLTTTINSGVSQWTTTGNNIYYNTGNVGIGTDLPTHKLDVAGQIKADDAVHIQGTGYARLEVGGGTGAFIDLKTPDSDDYDLRMIHDSAGSKFISPNADVKFDVGGQLRTIIKAGGNVGIGTDSPVGNLHISSGTSGDATLILEADTDNNNEADNPKIQLRQDSAAVNGEIYMEGNSATAAVATLSNALVLEARDTNGNNHIQFVTGGANSTSSQGTTRMTIKNDGKIGINTTSPASTLHVNGIITSTANPVFKKNVPVIEFRSPDGTNGMNIKANLSNDTNHGLQFEDVNGLNKVVVGPTGDVSFYNETNDTTAKFRWDASAERLGIGTNNPNKKLHVKDGDIRIESTFPRLFLTDSNNNSDFSIINNNGKFSIYDDTNATYRMAIDSAGKVGIGTNLPDVKLDVEATQDTVANILSNGSYAAKFSSSTTGDAGRTQGILLSGVNANTRGVALLAEAQSEANAHDFVIATSALSSTPTESMRVTSSGKVGIGNTDPFYLLDIYGTTAVSARCQTNTTGALIAFKDATATEVTIPAAVGGIGNQLSFVTNNAEKVRIDSSGNVGIGTDLPAERLDIVGNIGVTGTVDGRDIATDGTKLDGIDASANNYTLPVATDAVTGGVKLGSNTTSNVAPNSVSTTASRTYRVQKNASQQLMVNVPWQNTTYTVGDGGLTTNDFTNADHTKLNGIEANATADQTDAEIKTAYENNADTNAFTDADHTKLNGIDAGAQQCSTGNVTSAGALMDSELANITAVKQLNQNLNTTNSVTFGSLQINNGTPVISMKTNSATVDDFRISVDSSSGDITFQNHTNMGDQSGTVTNFMNYNQYGLALGNNGANTSSQNNGVSVSGVLYANNSFQSTGTITGNSTMTVSGNVSLATGVGSTCQIATQGGGVTMGYITEDNTINGNTTCNHNLTALGDVVLGSATNDTRIQGNLDVTGSINSLNQTSLNIVDGQITMNHGYTGTAPLNLDIISERGSYTNAMLQWNDSNHKWLLFSPSATTTSSVTPSAILTPANISDEITQLALDSGSATAPAYTFDGDTNTGMYSPAADTLAFSEGGAERMRINSAGKVLIGTTSQGAYSAKLRVSGGRIEGSGYIATGNSSLFLQGGYQGSPTIECRSYSSYSSTTQNIMKFANLTGTLFGSITITGSSTSFNTTSDERLKENIIDAVDAGSKIDAIRIRQFDWKGNGEHQDYGVVAQELQSVAPEAVSEGYDEEDMWSVDYSKLVPTLIKEIQSLRNRVAQLEND